MDIQTGLFAVSLIILFGFFAEFIFRKFRIPDVLFLIVLGFVIGPHVLGYIAPVQLATFAPFFTAFTLLFLLFDGAFNIDLVSFAKGIYKGFSITLFNFIVSSAVVALIMKFFGFPLISSILTGFILGGISSSFVIPVLKQLCVKKEVFSLLTLESAFTDVFCIVFSLTVIELIKYNNFQIQIAVSKVVSLFAVACLIGIVGGIIWLIFELNFFKEHKSYMSTIAFLILVYVVTEFLNGNGAIAALFFGLVLKNSKQLISISKGMVSTDKKEQKQAITGELGVSVTSLSERFFYDQLSFFLKTFFFVYIGVMLDISNYWLIIIGFVIAFAVFFSRNLSSLVTRSFTKNDRKIITSFSARGLAAAALAQILIQENIPFAGDIITIVFAVITGTIILNSIRIFTLSFQIKSLNPEAEAVGEVQKSVKSGNQTKTKTKLIKKK